MKAIVLCAGQGTRLGHWTRATPKPLLPIAGIPLVGHTLRLLSRQGFDDIAMNLHTFPEQFPSALGDGQGYGVRITYFHERELLGTAGALVPMRDWASGSDPVLVVYGDLLLGQDFRPMLREHCGTARSVTLLVHQRPGSNSLVAMDESRRVIGFLERPTDDERRRHPFPYVNSGVALLSPEFWAHLPTETPSDLPRDVYAKRASDGCIYGFPLDGYRCAIDSPERYAQAIRDVEGGKVERALE